MLLAATCTTLCTGTQGGGEFERWLRIVVTTCTPSVDATADNGRMGRLVNHSRTNPNVVTKVEEVEGKPRLYLMADRDIEPGEELQYDYGDRSPEVLQAHPWLLS